MQQIKALIRDIPDFPKPGIVFKDLTPLMRDPDALRHVTTTLAHPFRERGVTAVAAMEARGFIFGVLVASALEVGFVPLRKPGKLPAAVYSAAYELEYGATALEMHRDALDDTDKVLLVDDLIATGGTAAASCALVERAGAEIVGCAFVIELDFLAGRKSLADHIVHSLIHF